MAIFEEIMKLAQLFLPFGELGLFAIAFIEASVFLIPPDLILIPLVLANPELGLWYAFVCICGSVLGAVFGYFLGKRGGRPVLKKIVPENTILKVEEYFQKYGELAVGIAALTPIPYIAFTTTAGAMKMDLNKVVFVSILGRTGRFLPLTLVLMYFGEPIIGFLTQWFEVLTFGIGVLVVIGWFIWKKFVKKN
jgi:membrane protein YqaA with SNARE-associated domain